MLAINKDGSYLLQAGIMKVTAQPDEVYLIEETKQQTKKIIERSQRAFRSAGASTELDLRGMSADEAIATLDIFLDNAMMANLASVRIIHGKGTGVLRKAVQDELKRNRCVKRYRLGVYGEGEDGVTIADLACREIPANLRKQMTNAPVLLYSKRSISPRAASNLKE